MYGKSGKFEYMFKENRETIFCQEIESVRLNLINFIDIPRVFFEYYQYCPHVVLQVPYSYPFDLTIIYVKVIKKQKGSCSAISLKFYEIFHIIPDKVFSPFSFQMYFNLLNFPSIFFNFCKVSSYFPLKFWKFSSKIYEDFEKMLRKY